MQGKLTRQLNRRCMEFKHRQAITTVLTYLVLSLAGIVTFTLPNSLPEVGDSVPVPVTPQPAHTDSTPEADDPPEADRLAAEQP